MITFISLLSAGCYNDRFITVQLAVQEILCWVFHEVCRKLMDLFCVIWTNKFYSIYNDKRTDTRYSITRIRKWRTFAIVQSRFTDGITCAACPQLLLYEKIFKHFLAHDGSWTCLERANQLWDRQYVSFIFLSFLLIFFLIFNIYILTTHCTFLC